MRIVSKRISGNKRALLRQLGGEALRAARLSSTMRNKVVYATVGTGGGQAGFKRYRMGVLADVCASFNPGLTEYRSYYLPRIPPFYITKLSPEQRWAFLLVHEAAHIKQRMTTRRYSEVEAERAVLRAHAKLNWGRKCVTNLREDVYTA